MRSILRRVIPLLVLVSPAPGCEEGCSGSLVTVNVTDSFDVPLPGAYVELYTPGAVPIPCPNVGGHTFECMLPGEGDFNVYATEIDHAPFGTRVTSDCGAEPLITLDVRLSNDIGGM